MMSDQSDTLSRRLTGFGLSADEADIYLHLLQKSPQSALEMSRQLRIARTKVYRLVDKLIRKGLVRQQAGALGLKFAASPYEQLELLIAQKQVELEGLKTSLPTVFSQLHDLTTTSTSGSQVFTYHGVDGLKHVTWNSLQAKGTLRIYEVSESMTAFLPQAFSEKVREELVRNKIHTHQLTNLSKIAAYTDVKAMVRDFWTVKHIDPKELAITSEVLIYNDVTALYHYKNNDIFCVEIHSADLAHMQVQQFDFVWKRAQPMKKMGDHGEARLDHKK